MYPDALPGQSRESDGHPPSGRCRRDTTRSDQLERTLLAAKIRAIDRGGLRGIGPPGAAAAISSDGGAWTDV
jgi:hypothetical protein